MERQIVILSTQWLHFYFHYKQKLLGFMIFWLELEELLDWLIQWIDLNDLETFWFENLEPLSVWCELSPTFDPFG